MTTWSAIVILALVPASLPSPDPAGWDAILKAYVSTEHRVNYAALKKHGIPQLEDYITSLAKAGERPLRAEEEKAVLINAYNAMTVEWIVQNYPVPSIWRTPVPFKRARHRLAGEMVSLDDIESRLRHMGDPRIHAALVCAARSCPPLRREAYLPGRVDQQLDANLREWLANAALNEFRLLPGRATASISPIFKWYGKDFEAYPGGLEGLLRKYAPAGALDTLGGTKVEIEYQSYNWGLNDQSDLGSNYSGWDFWIDWIRDRVAWLSK